MSGLYKVLIIDDDADQVHMLSDRLEYEGMVPMTALDGIQGLATAKNRLPDIILLDIMMPKMNGMDVLKKLKKNKKTKNIPVVMLTAKSTISDMQKCLELGAVSYESKPYSADILLNKIRAICQKNKGEDPVPHVKPPVVSEAPEAKKERKDSSHRLRILVVDDNMDAVEMLYDRFEMEGFQVDVAYNGEEAMVKIKNMPDIIILDIMMPGMDGYEVLTRLKQDQETAAITVIVSSAKSSPEDIEKAIGLGAAAYVTKPYKISQLLETIKEKS